MKKKTRLIIAAVCALIFFTITIILVNLPTAQDELIDILNRTENALGDEWEKQSMTKISDLVYSDDEGNTIVYHICVTTYYGADAASQTGLNTDAISGVICPDEAESFRECTVSNLPAMIYQKAGRAYLCWTIMPELSCVIEYDPTIQIEEDILRMAESVPANTVNP